MAASLAVFGGAAYYGSTGAFFSDSETSTANVFTAGSVDLTVDSQAHYAGLVCVIDGQGPAYHWVQDGSATVTRPDLLNTACSNSWAATDLGPTNKFFNYSDVKPGDLGENTISLHATNDSWMCADLKVTSNIDGESGPTTIASSYNTSFEPATFAPGNINLQGGWAKTGPYDVAISNTNIPGTFGTQSLRISDSVTSGSFGDQTFSPSLTNEAGEDVDAVNDGMSGGTRQPHFEAQFDIASALPAQEQTGLHMVVSPDRGDGARMSYLRFEDQADGIHVFFYDVQGVNVGFQVANFVETPVATITRAPHTIKLTMDFVPGPSNDVVKVYVDGNLVHTGTSWENYYRYDTESQPNVSYANKTRTVDSLLFRESSTANVANAGNGFLVDNLSMTSGTVAAAGAFADGIQFASWIDNASTSGAIPGDNIHQASEPLIYGPAAFGATATTTLALADAAHGSAFSSSGTHYVGLAWCAGAMSVNGGTGAITCNGATMGNEAQNDSMTADITLRAEQSRNNSTFLCNPQDQ